MTRKRPSPKNGLLYFSRLLFALDDAAEASGQKRTSGTVPTLRLHLMEALKVLVRATAEGVSSSLSPEDALLVTEAWRIGNMMLDLAASIEAGDGNQQEQTPYFQCEVGSLRELARDVIAKVYEVPRLKRGFNITGDELAVLLKASLQDWFKSLKRQRKTLPRDQIVDLAKAKLSSIAAEVGFDFYDADIEKVCTGPLADLLERRAMPSRAAVDATVILLRRTYQVSPDAVKEGAAKRLARRNPNATVERPPA